MSHFTREQIVRTKDGKVGRVVCDEYGSVRVSFGFGKSDELVDPKQLIGCVVCGKVKPCPHGKY